MEADDFIPRGGNADGFREVKVAAFGAYPEDGHDFRRVAIQKGVGLLPQLGERSSHLQQGF